MTFCYVQMLLTYCSQTTAVDLFEVLVVLADYFIAFLLILHLLSILKKYYYYKQL